MADKFDTGSESFNVGRDLLAKNLVELNATAVDPNVAVPWTFTRSSLAKEFIGRFDPTKVAIVRPTKVVVVSQEPGPDIFLPAGTPVNLFMAVKEDLPVESFNNIEAVVTGKYTLVGTLIEDLEKNDAAAKAAKKVLDEKSEVKYSELQPQDVKAVNAFIKDRFNVNADVAADKDKAANIYENLRFLNSF